MRTSLEGRDQANGCRLSSRQSFLTEAWPPREAVVGTPHQRMVHGLVSFFAGDLGRTSSHGFVYQVPARQNSKIRDGPC